MRSLLFYRLTILFFALPLTANGQNATSSDGSIPDNARATTMAPAGALLVKGAWASASDSMTALPESANVTNSVFHSEYFGITYSLPQGWVEKYKGPPPSDSGRYVLAQIRPAEMDKGSLQGNILITAQDMFFTPLRATSALDLLHFTADNLQGDYKIEVPPTQTSIARHSFTLLKYWSPVTELHWYVLAADIRCHAVEIVLTSRDSRLLDRLLGDMDKLALSLETTSTALTPAEANPTCIKGYVREENVVTRVEPIFTEHRFNPVPVRIVIDKKGTVKHIHFLSAFPDQSKAITDALKQWKFKPYLHNGEPQEVETGILFGRTLSQAASAETGAPSGR